MPLPFRTVSCKESPFSDTIIIENLVKKLLFLKPLEICLHGAYRQALPPLLSVFMDTFARPRQVNLMSAWLLGKLCRLSAVLLNSHPWLLLRNTREAQGRMAVCGCFLGQGLGQPTLALNSLGL